MSLPIDCSMPDSIAAADPDVDAAMQPGFAEGYEASFQQLDTLVKEL